MLVLSRRPEEKIILPTVPAVIKVIATQAGLVRLGIEAPAHVPILREELCQGEGGGGRTAVEGAGPRESLRHRLHNLTLGLALLRVKLEGTAADALAALDGLEEELSALRAAVTGAVADAASGAPVAVRA